MIGKNLTVSPDERLGVLADDGGLSLSHVVKPAAGEHPAAVFDGDTKVADLKFSIISGGAQINTDIFG